LFDERSVGRAVSVAPDSKGRHHPHFCNFSSSAASTKLPAWKSFSVAMSFFTSASSHVTA
jgi:hypothetical protein